MPGWGMSQRLSRRIGIARAKEMSFTGNFIDAATAERWGLVNRVVPNAELLDTAIQLAKDMLDGGRTLDFTLWRIVNLGMWGERFGVGM